MSQSGRTGIWLREGGTCPSKQALPFLYPDSGVLRAFSLPGDARVPVSQWGWSDV